MSHILLIGFMGAGKSRVGAALARDLGMGFVDLDRLIEEREGATIPQIFASRGEGAFRDAEHAALLSLVDTASCVVACGGGIVIRDENRALLRRLGTVVYLSVTAEEALARIGDTTGRPLLSGDGARLAPQILASRLALYRSASDFDVDTSGRMPEEVLARVLALLPPAAIRVSGAQGYGVAIGPGVLGTLGDVVRSTVRAARVAIVSDSNVAPLYLSAAKESLEAVGVETETIIIEAGEPSKNWEQAGAIVSALSEYRLGRDGAVVALGGGVVGDLAGFAAAVYVRGIPVVQVPTTLLAQVDSSIGGKTGVDLPAGKNLAGAFWQPAAVIADTDTLTSLPDVEWASGLAEVAKSVLLAGESQTAQLEADSSALRERDSAAVLRAVRMAAGFKAEVVSRDEREGSDRECLNLGHTLGHAIERVLGYGRISHGAAVGIGMRFAARLAEEIVGAPVELTARTHDLLDGLGVVQAVPSGIEIESVLDALLSDKKTRGGIVRFVLVREPGVWSVEPVDLDVVRRHLELFFRSE